MNDFLPIFNNRCSQCHSGDAPRGGPSLSSYPSLMAELANGPVIIPGDEEYSVLLKLVKKSSMPKRGAHLLPAHIHILNDWVSSGALDD